MKLEISSVFAPEIQFRIPPPAVPVPGSGRLTCKETIPYTPGILSRHTPTKRFSMDLARLSKVLGVIARYGFGPFLSGGSIPGISLVTRSEDVPPQPASERFKLMLEELGPIFIKFGQLLSTRPDILPPNFITALSELQEDVAPLPWDLIATELKTHLPRDPKEIFLRIDPEPLASASVSQVHRATLKNGAEVVIKIRRPEIDEIIRADMEFMRGAAKLLESTIVEMSRHDPESWVNEFALALELELDLINEVRAIETFSANGSQTGHLVVPRVYPEYCSPRIIVMEYLQGTSVIKVEDPEERRRVARIIVGEAYKQIFVDGFFHADPHPGNVRYLEDGRIGMIDFGLVGRISPRMRDLIVKLTMAVAVRDATSAAKTIYSAGVAKERIDLTALSRDIDQIFSSTLGKSLQDIDTQYVVFELMEVISKHGVTLPSGLALLGKAGVNIEGVIRTLDPEIDLSKEALPYAHKLLPLPDDPMSLLSEVMKQFLRLKGTMDELPVQLDQILLDVSTGKMNINVTSRQMEGLVPALRELGGLLATGMVAAASIVAAALLVIPHFGNTLLYGIPVLAVIAVCMAVVAGFLMNLVIGWAVFRGRDLRIRLSSWVPFLRRRIESRKRKKDKAAENRSA
jgi:ubiquinone biosynthesis protein